MRQKRMLSESLYDSIQPRSTTNTLLRMECLIISIQRQERHNGRSQLMASSNLHHSLTQLWCNQWTRQLLWWLSSRWRSRPTWTMPTATTRYPPTQLWEPRTSLESGVGSFYSAQEDVVERFSQFGTIVQIKITPEYPEQNILRAGSLLVDRQPVFCTNSQKQPPSQCQPWTATKRRVVSSLPSREESQGGSPLEPFPVL